MPENMRSKHLRPFVTGRSDDEKPGSGVVKLRWESETLAAAANFVMSWYLQYSTDGNQIGPGAWVAVERPRRSPRGAAPFCRASTPSRVLTSSWRSARSSPPAGSWSATPQSSTSMRASSPRLGDGKRRLPCEAAPGMICLFPPLNAGNG